MNPFPTFEQSFEALTGHRPMRWQGRLYGLMLAGSFPAACSLPTGLGKTAVIPIWLIALASRLRAPTKAVLPRRLVYIVNRRTVVDQATDVVAQIRARLDAPEGHPDHKDVLTAISRQLHTLSGVSADEIPFAVSTLRGELADNGEWKEDPARAAVVVGTIDMIGSKLLFSGYGDGRYLRAHHAGLIGQDTLIVHDEAHLSPAFSRLLWKVEREQREAGEERPVSVIELSATARLERLEDRDQAVRLRPTDTGAAFELDDEDRAEERVKDRLAASKRLTIIPLEGDARDALVAALVKQAVMHDAEQCRVLIYVRSPEVAKAVRDALTDAICERSTAAGRPIADADARARVGLLTGTIRGFERDQLARSTLFQAFKSNAQRPTRLAGPTLYLLSTSAGEVGADLDADQMVCDLATLDSMAQRLGRVNRLGGRGRAAQVVVIVQKPGKNKDEEASPLDKAIAATDTILQAVHDGGGDASPAALAQALARDGAELAFTPQPTFVPATDILLDSWSLTSIIGGLPGRPEVGPYLYGIADWEPPETYVAWRADVAHLAAAGATADDLEQVFDVFPLRSIERVRDRSDRVLAEFAKLATRHPETKVILTKGSGVRWTTLSEIGPEGPNGKDAAVAQLAFATVVLPVEVGGLKEGCLDGECAPPADPRTLDVAETSMGSRGDRQRVWLGGERDGESLLGSTVTPGLLPRHTARLREADEGVEDGSVLPSIEYRVARRISAEPGRDQSLAEHNASVRTCADKLATALGLSARLAEAVLLAAELHDSGKDRSVWQRYANNTAGAKPLAKAASYAAPHLLGGYRHEFGSLLDGMDAEALRDHPERDAVLHLIATHHGWARPHFEPRGYDHERFSTEANEAAAAEVMRRFGKLQQRFGRWGLAWIESLLRCADGAASTAVGGAQVRVQQGQETLG